MVQMLGFFSLILLPIPACAGTSRVTESTTACYYMSRANENEVAPLTTVWLQVEGRENHADKKLQWWSLVMRKMDGSILAVRILSERIPMIEGADPGTVARYQYSPRPGVALEYLHQEDGQAMLPEVGFPDALLPRPAPDALYPDGFASTGNLLGHALTRAAFGPEIPVVDFSQARRLELRTGMIIGSSRPIRDNGKGIGPNGDYTYVNLTARDIADMERAGFNYFDISSDLRPLVENEPVFFLVRRDLAFPDDLYRSNLVNRFRFLDEPMTRLEWTYDLEERPESPEMVANMLRTRVRGLQSDAERRLDLDHAYSPGLLELLRPLAPSWETHFWSAWHQMEAGATALIHEGRYAPGTWGYVPEFLLGKDLSVLDPNDQYKFVFAFLRGAARSFDGQWGTSLYGQAWEGYRLPAFIEAYDMGATYFLFWTSGSAFHVPHAEQLRIARALTDHAMSHPRPDSRTLLSRAEVGIALPSGYAFSWDGVWGMPREKSNAAGVSYGDVCAAMAWEGFLCSRSGIEYDFLVDHPGIEKLGYKRLVRIQEDGSFRETPRRTWKRPPRNLRIEIDKAAQFPVTDRLDLEPRHRLREAQNIVVDGRLADWADAEWIDLDSASWRGDDIPLTLALTMPARPLVLRNNIYAGMSFENTNDELVAKYRLDNWPEYAYSIITHVTPDSPAEKCGIREGDLIQRLGGRDARSWAQWKVAADKYGSLPGEKMEIRVKRSGRDNYNGPADLFGQVAFMMNERHLYFAARVRDETHVQNRRGLRLWEHDSVQLALDPILDRTSDHFGENDHEFILALKDGKPEIWRTHGRRGQLLDRVESSDLAIIRESDTTIYEVSIPLIELRPMAPAVWPRFGANVVFNDNDGDTEGRKGRIELVPGASGTRPHPQTFMVFECPDFESPQCTNGALFWSIRCMKSGSSAVLQWAGASTVASHVTVDAELASLDSPESPSAHAEAALPVSATPAACTLRFLHDSPAGRYRLAVTVREPGGETITEETQNIYVYPK